MSDETESVSCLVCEGEKEIDCEYCESGEVECNCPECGDDHMRECDNCEGLGRVICSRCNGTGEVDE